jgi:ribosomal 50S subunit-recycling heat shock protein
LRIDIYLSKVGIVKRRSIAKELGDKGLIKINQNTAKPSREINIGDIIYIGGKKSGQYEVIEIPTGSVKKEEREKYFRRLGGP